MAKKTDSQVLQQLNQNLPLRAYALVRWWHQQYDNTWLVACPTQYPTEEWVKAFVFQEHCLNNFNGINNAALNWGITSTTVLTLQQYESTRVGEFDELFTFAIVKRSTIDHIAEYGYNIS